LRTRIVLIVVVAVAAGCGAGGRSGTRVVASFYPLAFAAQALRDPSVSVENLTPPGAEPHDLEATPHDVRDLQGADLVLLMGDGFQPQLENAAGSGKHVVRVLKGHAGEDPHVWLDPIRYAAIVTTVGRALGRPAAAERVVARLQALDRAYRRGLAHCARRSFVTSHEAFGYLARRYGLRQIAVTGLVPDTEPTPGALNDTIRAVRASGATTVFTEPLVSARIADTVARETGTHTAVLDPLEGQPKRGDYFTAMRTNLAELRKALGCR
jgi:zinc transport system substrate-binding protein